MDNFVLLGQIIVTNMVPKWESGASRNMAVRITNSDKTIDRSDLFADNAVSISMCPKALPSSSEHALVACSWAKYLRPTRA
jgi:hypothetical protein